MSERCLAAVVQLNSGEDKQRNIDRASELVSSAAARGATLVALPEMFNLLGRFDHVVAGAEPIPGPTCDQIAALAQRLKITLLAGSICEESKVTGKAYNCSLLFGPDGTILAKYRKIHLFDVDLPHRVRVTESNWILPGEHAIIAQTEHGLAGLSICYDLRFAELYRRFAERRVEIIFIPSAFTFATGQDHWETLVRARAIENQAYVIAPNQCGKHSAELTTYGNSMIVDPWGKIITRLADQEDVGLAEISLTRLREIRMQLPALEHRRLGETL